MPRCPCGRWHDTDEERDACVKHLQNKHFDNLSTISRIWQRQAAAAAQPPPMPQAPAPVPPPVALVPPVFAPVPIHQAPAQGATNLPAHVSGQLLHAAPDSTSEDDIDDPIPPENSSSPSYAASESPGLQTTVDDNHQEVLAWLPRVRQTAQLRIRELSEEALALLDRPDAANENRPSIREQLAQVLERRRLLALTIAQPITNSTEPAWILLRWLVFSIVAACFLYYYVYYVLYEAETRYFQQRRREAGWQ